MNEAVTKRFLLYFRLMLLVWILIANAIIHLTGMEYSWLIFLSNIMMFTLEGDVKDRLVTVELGGLVGLVLTVAALLSISALTPVLGDFLHPAGLRRDRPVHPVRVRTARCAGFAERLHQRGAPGRYRYRAEGGCRCAQPVCPRPQ